MNQVEKAVLNLTTGVNLNREDLSNTISLVDGPSRPVTQAIKQVKAKNTTHQWNEQGLNKPARTNAAGGGATYAEGSTPPGNAKAANRKTNVTCRSGRLAQVTDSEMAAFNGGGTLVLAEGEMEKQIADALEFETALVAVEVLNQIEWMHITGDSANATMEGGETDGLNKWATNNGQVVATGGTTSVPVNFIEQYIKDGARSAAQAFPVLQANTLLVPPELIPDLAAMVSNGAGRPLVQVTNGNNVDLVAGAQVGYYNTGYSVLKIKTEPYLSPAYNASLPQCAIIGYNDTQVAHANLIPFGSERLARTGTSVQNMVTCEYAQEHRVPLHTFIIPNVKSAIA